MAEKRSKREFTVADIAPYVLAVLEAQNFFALLDDDFLPAHVTAPLPCDHTFRRTDRILRQLGMNSEDVEEVTLVMIAGGACCDCEVLYNVAQESRVKAMYWKARGAGLLDG
jgi:hypothetical protein